MEKYFKSHKVFSVAFTVWVILQIFVLLYFGIGYDKDSLVFPFESFDLKYFGIWELIISDILIVWGYNSWFQRNNSDNEDEIFSKANVEFIADHDLNTRIIEIIRGADKFLMLVSPYIRLSPPIKKELKLIQGSDIEVYLIFGKNEGNVAKSLVHDDLLVFKAFKNISIVYADTLHAKFYANENYMILTSMNLLEYSQIMNSECGIRIKPTSILTDEENKIWNRTLNYFKDLYDTSTIIYKRTGSEIVDNTEMYYAKVSSDLAQNRTAVNLSDELRSTKNAGSPWSDKEEVELLELYRNGKTIDEIARILERKVGGIKARLQKLGEIEE